jgi:hypothetical protein
MLKEAPHEIAPVDWLSTDHCAYEAKSEAGPRSPRHVDFGNGIFFPSSSSSVLVVIDENGYLTPLLTAGDLLRLCKEAWRAEGLR